MKYALHFGALLLFSVGTLSLVGCGGSEPVNIDGSSTVYLITKAVEETYTKENPNARISIQISGTGGGMKKFTQGTIDICDASRAIKEGEIEECKKNGVEFIELQVAYDGIAVITNPDSDFVDDLTVDQLKEMWRPESSIKQWKDINADWPPEDIKLYGPDEDSGTYEYFTDKIVGVKNSSRKDYQANADDNALARGVAGDKFSLGFFGFAYYVANEDKLKLLSVDGEQPSQEAIQTGTYKPLSRPLFIYINKKSLERPEVAEFAKFYLDHCAELSEKVGYVRLKDEEQAASKSTLDEALK